MSRSGYTDDCENLGSWRGAVQSAINGRRGQSFLKELASQLDAMPEKKLIKHELIDAQGQCCTIGVVCKARGINVLKVDTDDPEDVGRAVGISHAMAAEIEYLNDEEFRETTPERRWELMREWVAKQILQEPTP